MKKGGGSCKFALNHVRFRAAMNPMWCMAEFIVNADLCSVLLKFEIDSNFELGEGRNKDEKEGIYERVKKIF